MKKFAVDHVDKVLKVMQQQQKTQLLVRHGFVALTILSSFSGRHNLMPLSGSLNLHICASFYMGYLYGLCVYRLYVEKSA